MTLPHFEIRASDYLDISGAQQIAFAPIVSDQNREEWEAYTVANQDWIQAGIDLEYLLSLSEEKAEEETNETKHTVAPGTNKEGFASVQRAQSIQSSIWRHAPLTHRAETDLHKGPHVPLWQSYPAPRNAFVVNFNLLSSPEFQELINVTMSTRRAVLSNVIDNFVLFGSARTIDVDPKSVAIQPIFQSFDDAAQIVGYLIVVMPWYIYFNDVLSNEADPVYCVLRNSCGEAFTYRVAGRDATFMGEGDWHDPRYDDLELSSNFLAYQKGYGDVKHHYALHHSVESVCAFSLHVYPTQEMEDRYHTEWPIYITMAVIGVFAFTTMVFVLYDHFVQRRQSIVAATAQKTTALVTR